MIKMASSVAVNIEELRPSPEPRTAKSPKTRSSSLKHKTRFPTETVKQSEESLRQLLVDFEHGKLNAFGMFSSVLRCIHDSLTPTGNSDMLQKMKDIREMQEKLTIKHFEIDQSKMVPDTASNTAVGEDREDSQLSELTQALEKLGSTIQSLNSRQPHRKPRDSKKVSMKLEQEDDDEQFADPAAPDIGDAV